MALTINHQTNDISATSGSMTIDGAAVGGGGGGVDGFSSADNTSSPNDTVNVASLSVDSSSTNAAAAIVPKGTGAFMLAIPDSGTTGGNVRGASAIDLTMGRTNANQVASGANAIAIGYRMRAAGSQSICLGYNNYATNTRGFTVGNDSNSSSIEGVNILGGGAGGAFGSYGAAISSGSKCGERGFAAARGRSTTKNSVAFGGGGVQSNQRMFASYWGRTTNATPATISASGLNQSDSEANFLMLVPDGTYFYTKNIAFFTINIVANDDTNELMRVWELSAAYRISTGGTVTQVGSTTKTVIHSEGTALNSTDVGLSVSTNRRLVIDVTGVASTNIHFTAWVTGHANRYA